MVARKITVAFPSILDHAVSLYLPISKGSDPRNKAITFSSLPAMGSNPV